MMLNEIVSKLVKESGLNQKEFANKYKISYSSLNHILTNENVCGFKFLEKLANKMNKKIKIEIL